MKRMFLVVFIVLLCTSVSYAKDLNDGPLDSFALSNQVAGEYQVDAARATYLIYTGHSKGNAMYGSGSFVTAVYAQSFGDDLFVSTDFPAEADDFTSGAFDDAAWVAK